MLPLTPAVPEFAVLNVNAPLLVLLPNPVTTETDPPVTSVLSPALATRRPPAPLSPPPTTTLILPPVPDVAVPVLITIEPLLPLEDVPVLSEIAPLTPVEPASDVSTLNAPLEVAVPNPDARETDPPV